MEQKIKKHKMHPVLAAALTASVVVLVLSGCWRILELGIYGGQQENNQIVQNSHQAWLTARLNRFISQDSRSKAVLSSRLNELSSRQDASEKRGGQPPFSAEDLVPSIVEIFCLDNNNQQIYYTASGTIIDKDGYVLTNRHAMTSEDGGFIRFCGVGFTVDQRQPPKPEYVAMAMAVHKRDDLAILRITERLDGNDLPEEFAFLTASGQSETATELKLGDAIFIGGYPGIGAETFTFTEGVVSGRVGDGLIKTSALIDSGTSGGAAFDVKGKFIGVPTAAIKGNIGGSLGYLIGADVVDEFLKDFYAHQLPTIETSEHESEQ